jgi:hypothetical protein
MRAACEGHLARCNGLQLARMKEQAAQWAQMCAPGPRAAGPVEQMQRIAHVRTVWLAASPYRS